MGSQRYRQCRGRSARPTHRPADGHDDVLPAAGATAEGVHGLAGNVWEWVRPDWLKPRMAMNQEARRLRGGSGRDDPLFLRTANRNNQFT